MIKAFCERCKEEINLKKDDYFKIETYSGKKLEKTGWLHKACNEQMNMDRKQTVALLNSVNEMANRVGGMLDQAGFENKKVVEIK